VVSRGASGRGERSLCRSGAEAVRGGRIGSTWKKNTGEKFRRTGGNNFISPLVFKERIGLSLLSNLIEKRGRRALKQSKRGLRWRC